MTRQIQVGDSVMVNMGGFSHGGVSMGDGAMVSGTVRRLTTQPGGGMLVEVHLNGAVIAGIDTVQVSPDRLTFAGR